MTNSSDILITPSDLPYRLSADAYAYLVRTLASALPPPPDDSDETKRLRKQTIIAHISTLRPNDSIETSLATDYILASEQSRDAIRWVHIYRAQGEHKLAAQCDAKALAWGRQAVRILREIHRRQAETRERHASPEAIDKAERIEHIAMIMTAEAIEQAPDPTPIPYVPQRPLPPKPIASKTTPKSHETKTEIPPRQPERPAKAPPAEPCSTRPNSAPAALTGTGPCSSPPTGSQNTRTHGKPRGPDNRPITRPAR